MANLFCILGGSRLLREGTWRSGSGDAVVDSFNALGHVWRRDAVRIAYFQMKRVRDAHGARSGHCTVRPQSGGRHSIAKTVLPMAGERSRGECVITVESACGPFITVGTGRLGTIVAGVVLMPKVLVYTTLTLRRPFRMTSNESVYRPTASETANRNSTESGNA
ncbi:hypothetical protein BV898_06128 [Hypsibius exemplaris]|uniref:Uncharacterized protein n=1 Tax=Hypsibius exemplaris TaxID=2072580 RepID=A0A1W0WXC1_HYPEX|nr:hypothetical protein BV898_06128 [Hypsibius exemplaris]